MQTPLKAARRPSSAQARAIEGLRMDLKPTAFTTPLTNRLYAARALRGFGDGFAIIILPADLTALGHDAAAVGVVAAASLLGTALLTLAVGMIAPRHDLRNLMLFGAGLMAATGIAFAN